jgi:hypothetical protein
MRCRSWLIKWVAVLSLGLAAADGQAQVVIWNESTNGDLSNNQAAPTAFTLTQGVSAIIGSVTGGTDQQDWISLTVPAGFQLSSLILASYQSTDAQGFTGVQRGTSFVGSFNTAGSYLGYAHFGTGAANGSLPTANLVGADLLPIMSNPAAAPGSQGFTPPLGSGDYTFLIQQMGATTTGYQFNYTVAPVPEPGPLCLSGLGGALMASGWLRRRAAAKSARQLAPEPQMTASCSSQVPRCVLQSLI